MIINNVKAKIVKQVDYRDGETKDGFKWWKRDVLIEPYGSSAAKLVVTFFKEWADEFTNNFKEGDEIELDILVESKEHSGRWFNNVTCKDIIFSTEAKEIKEDAPIENNNATDEIEEENDLPF